MRNRFEYVLIGIVVLLGLFHTLSTIIFMRPFELDALMYTGTGLTFLFVAFINLIRLFSPFRIAVLFCILTNLLAMLFMSLILVEIADIRALAVIGSVLLLLIFSILDLRKEAKSINS